MGYKEALRLQICTTNRLVQLYYKKFKYTYECDFPDNLAPQN